MLLIPIIVSLIGLFSVFFLIWRINKQEKGCPEVQKIASYIHKGATVFLKKEYKILAVFIFIISLVLGFSPIGFKVALAFLLGALFSILAGNIGMRVATIANGRAATAAQKNIYSALNIAFSSGSAMGLAVVSLGLFGITLLYFIFHDPQIIYGFGFGASLVALFARVGGGIYTKAADIGADLVGKVEKAIPEDDPRNPAVIADNVGDNVGDVAGMGADLFESYVDSIITAMVLGSLAVGLMGEKGVLLPLLLAGFGILVSLVGIIAIRLFRKGNLHRILNQGIFISSGLMILVGGFFIRHWFNGKMEVFWALVLGLFAGIVIGLVTEYYTSSSRKPTQEVAESSQTGPATNIISGLSLGMQSTAVPVVAISLAMLFAYYLSGLYGVAIAAVGMLSTLGITLATDAYGPVADNAAGIAEMAHLGDETRKRCEELDAVGNTTAAIGKGFAIGSAALTALVLAASYIQIAGLQFLDVVKPEVMVGLFVGGLLTFVFCSLTLKAVGKAAFSVVYEVRRQFQDEKVIKGEKEPEYEQCVKIVTNSALKKMCFPSLMAVFVPLVIGFALGKEALGGLLIGAIVTGFLLAVTMANAGGAWDNAKKYIEEGNLGGKGSDPHKAAVIGDTVGDPMKDCSGPSLNILIKLISIIALIIAPLL